MIWVWKGRPPMDAEEDPAAGAEEEEEEEEEEKGEGGLRGEGEGRASLRGACD